MKFRRIALIVALSCGVCSAQSQMRVPSTNVAGAEYPRLNADLSATFRVQAADAQKVQLLMELGQATYDMTKSTDGPWEVTTKPLLPGFHYYLISVDGFASTDPGSKTFFAARKEVSAIEVPSPESDFFAAKNVPHGAVRIEWYFSKVTGEWRRIFDYTLPGYKRSTERYPVLYLQHGWGEDETGWSHQGHENFILDNLIAAHKAKPMIIVNENGMTGINFSPPPPPRRGTTPPASAPAPRSMANSIKEERYTLFDNVIANDLIPFIDMHFRTIPDRDHRALAGLSMGGGQAVRIGMNHLNLFSYLGAFSPAFFFDDPGKDYDGAFSDARKVNSELHLLWIGVGNDDFLLGPVTQSHEALERAGINHVWLRSSGAHVWTVWRKYLADFAPKLFQ
ncbi:MAG TPA: alpha/beta hydrolase-fold protein [Pyrinomonadaceae bacterium]|nr:alpha/beta hydrolase-fold protein [Pyrinomonadaceae bacterium]